MKQTQIIYNQQTFTSTPPEQKVNFPNVKRVNLVYEALENGTTANALSTLIATFLDVKVKIGGEQVTNIRGDDLFALNWIEAIHKKIGSKPTWLLGTGTDNVNTWLKLSVPMEITTDKDVYIQPEFYAAPQYTDTGTLTIEIEYGDIGFKEPPIRMTYISQNTAIAFVQYDFNNAGHKLCGILIYSTTVAAGSSVKDASAGEVKLYVNTKEKIYSDWFASEGPEDDVEDTVVHAILTHYRYIDLWDEPIPADQLKIAFKSKAAATDAVRVIGVYR